MKKNITSNRRPYGASRRRKPLLNDLVVNLVASFGEAVSLKKYFLGLFAFMLLLVLSSSGRVWASSQLFPQEQLEITRVASLTDLSLIQQQELLLSVEGTALDRALLAEEIEALNPETRPSVQLRALADTHVYLMGAFAQGLPYTITLGGQEHYSLEEIALKHYGSASVVESIRKVNAGTDFSRLKTGDRIYLPLINLSAGTEVVWPETVPAEALEPAEVLEEPAPAEAQTEDVSAETPAEETAAPTAPASVAPETAATDAASEAPGTSSEHAPTPTPTPVPTTAATTSPEPSYVVSASADVVDMYVRIVAAESSPSWGYEGQLMVAQTIINRALSGYWGDLRGVLTASGQYDVYASGWYLSVTPTEQQRRAAMDALYGSTAFGRDVIYFCTEYAYSPNNWWGSLDHRATYGNTMFFAP